MAEAHGESVRPTIRCLKEDLQLKLPPAHVPLDEIDEQVITKVQMTPAEVAANAAERIKSLRDRIWFKQRAGDFRAAVTEIRDSGSDLVDGWWLGAAGARSQGSPDDFYAELEATAKRHGKGTKVGTDTSWLLPTEDDTNRLILERVYEVTKSIRETVRRLVAKSLRTGKPWTVSVTRHSVTAHVRAADGEAYLIVCAEGWFEPEVIAVILSSVPGIPQDDWQVEPGGAVGVEPAPGQIIYSTLIPPAVQDAMLDEYPDEGAL
ncbi:hypothetical protein [uncultured Cellulomonas sp.]|uniref:hypothetical protein n=1 Tax=uncultured Cellulomonas sp. TaxID=189682 RepID=UPI0028EB54FA|nr:hypothetical protein [uncultured Cellulomonas sp.]